MIIKCQVSSLLNLATPWQRLSLCHLGYCDNTSFLQGLHGPTCLGWVHSWITEPTDFQIFRHPKVPVYIDIFLYPFCLCVSIYICLCSSPFHFSWVELASKDMWLLWWQLCFRKLHARDREGSWLRSRFVVGTFFFIRFAFGTFFFQGCVAKILGTKNLAKHWRYAAFRLQRGRPKIVASWLDSRCAFGTCFPQLGPRKFCVPNF